MTIDEELVEKAINRLHAFSIYNESNIFALEEAATTGISFFDLEKLLFETLIAEFEDHQKTCIDTGAPCWDCRKRAKRLLGLSK